MYSRLSLSSCGGALVCGAGAGAGAAPGRGVSLGFASGAPVSQQCSRGTQAPTDCRAASLRLTASAPQWLLEAERSSVAGSCLWMGCWWAGHQHPLPLSWFLTSPFAKAWAVPRASLLGGRQSGLPKRPGFLSWGLHPVESHSAPGHAQPRLSRGRWFAHGRLLFPFHVDHGVRDPRDPHLHRHGRGG